MDFKQHYNCLFQECKQLILEPKKFWSEQPDRACTEKVIPHLYVPLVLLVGLAVFLGEMISNPEFLLSYAFLKAMREVISYFLQLYIAVPVLTALLKNYGGTQNSKVVRFVLAYSLVPFLLASFITGLFPGLYVLSIIGFYGFYLFIQGAQSCFEIPEANQSRYIILAILLIILIFGLVNLVCWQLLMALFPYGA